MPLIPPTLRCNEQLDVERFGDSHGCIGNRPAPVIDLFDRVYGHRGLPADVPVRADNRMLDQRAERIRDSLAAAERASADAASSAERVEQELVNARGQGQALIAEARDAASRLKDQEAERTRAQVDEMLDRAREEIRREREAAVEEVRREFAGIAILAAERIVEQSLDEGAHRELIDRVLDEGLDARRN